MDKERKRIRQAFKKKPAVLARQMAIFDAFAAGNWDACKRLANALPYNDDDECSEKEYIGMDICNILRDTRDGGVWAVVVR